MELTRSNMDRTMYRLARMAATGDEKEARHPAGQMSEADKKKLMDENPEFAAEHAKNKDKFKKKEADYAASEERLALLFGDNGDENDDTGLEARYEDGKELSGKALAEWRKKHPELAENVDKDTLGLQSKKAVDWKAVAQELLDARQGRTQDDLHYRAYMRAIIAGNPSGHLADKFPGAREARQDLIDAGGRSRVACACQGDNSPCDCETLPGQRVGRVRLTQRQAAGTVDLWAAVYGDGALYGATDSTSGRDPRYWSGVASEEDFAIYKLSRVPMDLAEKLIDQGTRTQQFSDGYQAWYAAKRYAKDVLPMHMAADLTRQWDQMKTAGKALGLYGYTKSVQNECETAGRKLARVAGKLARVAYQKDERVAPFLGTHAKRASSLSAKILTAAMKDLGPKVASQMKQGARGAVEVTDPRGRKDILDADDMKENYGPGHEVTKELAKLRRGQTYRAADGWSFKKLAVQEETPETGKTASYSMYGYRTKTATLGLNACAALKTEAGRIASDLHRRRADKHAAYTGFLAEHGKQARCMYSKMLCAGYPDAEMRLASAAEPDGVDGWLVWED